MEYNSQTISGKSKVYGIIGDPVDHSMSPLIQNVAFRSTRTDAVYVPFQVSRDALKQAIQGLRALGVRGFNVTSPHKIAVLQCLSKLERTTADIGSVNTVLNAHEMVGYNTDGMGALRALEEVGERVEQRTILLFGAGGASRAIAYTLASKAKAMRLVNRTLSKAKQLERHLQRKFNVEITSTALSSTLIKELTKEADIIINASSMGMNNQSQLPIKAGWLRADQLVFDIVYKPVDTPLLKLGRKAGAKTLTGLDLLVHQGACSFELWTHKRAPISEMRNAISKKLSGDTS